MNRSNKLRVSALVILLAGAAAAATPAAAAGTAAPPEKLTVEKLFSADLTMKLATPMTLWLDSGLALLYDPRIEYSARTLELFDPETKTRRPAFPRASFIDGLKTLLGPEEPVIVTWPTDISPSGGLLLYEFNGDIFCFDTAASRWQRLTSTPDAETSSCLSPDGHWVAFIRGADLYAVERTTGREIRLTTGGTDTLLNGPLSWVYWEEIYEHARVPYAWSPDSRSIAYLQTDDSAVSLSTFVNFEPATQGVVRQRYPKAGQTNPKVRLGVVDLASARTTWIDVGPCEYIARFNWLPANARVASPAGAKPGASSATSASAAIPDFSASHGASSPASSAAVAAISPAATLAVQTLNRQQNQLRLLFADAATGASRLILEERQPAWVNLNNALTFLADGRRFLWLSERDGYQHLYLYNLDGTLVRQLTRGPFMVVSAYGDTCNRNKGLVGVDERGGWVYFTSNKDALPERHLYRIRLDGTGMTRLSTEPGIHTTTLSPTGRFYLDNFQSSATPPALTLHAAAGGKLAAAIAPALTDVIARFGIGTTEFLTYRAVDGTDCTLKLVKPADFDPQRRYPTLVYVYGGPGAQEVTNEWPRFLWDELTAQEGYLAVSVEVRAGLNKSKALETSAYRRAYGPLNVEDVEAAVRRLRELPFVDPDRLGLWGGSGGGCSTLYVSTHSKAFKAAIALYPVSDWHYYDTIYTERYLDTPQSNPDGYVETSSVLAARNLHGRLLIAHGTYDDNVHPQNTEAFIHELIAAGVPFEMMIYPWQKHGIGAAPDHIHLRKLMLDFWKRNL